MPLKSNISKKDMTEEDIKNRFVTPALNQAGWDHIQMKGVRMQEVGGSELLAYYLDFSGNRQRPLQHTPQVVVKTCFYAFHAE